MQAAAWPGVVIPDDVFASYLAAHPGAVAVSDLYLACALVERAAGALAAFERHCGPTIAAVAARVAAPIRDDLVQVVHDLLFVGGLVARYGGRGRLRSWVRIVATREALRLVKAQQRFIAVGDHARFDELAPSERPDPQLDYLKRHYGEVFRAAFGDAIAHLERKRRIALRMNVIDGCSIDAIAVAFRVHRSSAARWIAEARAELYGATLARLADELQITPGEVECVIGLVRSSVDVRLDALDSRC